MLHLRRRLAAAPAGVRSLTLYQNKPYVLNTPTEAAEEAIKEARRSVFGVVEGNNLRSGRKILRAKLKGPGIKAYYPLQLEDLRLDKAGVLDYPYRGDTFIQEISDNRMGKSRIKGKVRGPTETFVKRMKIEDAQESILDQRDYVHGDDLLPEDDQLGALYDGMDERESRLLTDLLGRMVSAAETEGDKVVKDGLKEDGSTVVVEANKADKVSRARSRTSLRKSLTDKRNTDDFDLGGAAAEGDEAQARGPAIPESVKKALEEIRELAQAMGVKDEDKPAEAKAEEPKQ